MCEGVDVGQLVAMDVIVEQPMILGVDSPWQVATINPIKWSTIYWSNN
jgi:hypothetical protein